jgi:serine/threonine-protein kinase
MSPEQARGEKTIDHRADVYALGAILYELLSGRKPHPGDSHNAILHHIATQPAVPLDSVEPELPAPLVLAIGRALSSDFDARFGSAELFAQEISKWAERKVWPVPERQPSSPVHEASEPTELAPHALERAPARMVDLVGSNGRALGARRSPKAVLVVLAGAAALAGLWFATRSPAEEKHVSGDVSAAPAALPEAAPVAPES